MKKLKYFFLLVFFYLTASVNAQNRTCIQSYMSPQSRIIFNLVQNDHSINLEFKNPLLKDSLIIKEILIDKPTQLFYSRQIIDSAKKSFDSESGSLFILPGDTLRLDRNGCNVHSSTGFKSFIEGIIPISLEEYAIDVNAIKAMKQELNDRGLRGVLQQINDRYEERNNSIKNCLLTNKVNVKQASILNNFNYVIRSYKISYIPSLKTSLSASEKSILDSCYDDILKNIGKISSISTNCNFQIYYSMIKYDALKNGNFSKDFWDYFNSVKPAIKEADFYHPYLVTQLHSRYGYNPKSLNIVVSKLSDQKKDLFIDTLRLIARSLLKSEIDMVSGRKELMSISKGKYAYFLPAKSMNKGGRNIAQLKSVKIVNRKGELFGLKEELLKGNVKITVIDLWASWCLPCIQDHAILNKIKPIFDPKVVKFIYLSIDRDETKWKKMLNEMEEGRDAHHYCLSAVSYQDLMRFFNISTIPRYIVVDRHGRILNEEFFRPNDVNFKRELNAFLASAEPQ